MNRNEQIEEMSWIITFKAFEQAHLENGDDYLSDIVATELYDKGYCKASEVAREIFAEIQAEIKAALDSNYKALPKVELSEELWSCVRGKIDCLRGLDDFIDELKKKYLEVDENA